MSADALSRAIPFVFGLLTFIALEFILLIAILLPLVSRTISTSRRPSESSDSPQGGAVTTDVSDVSRIEVVLIAPELVQAIKNITANLQVQPSPPSPVPAASAEPAALEPEDLRERDKHDKKTSRQATDIPTPLQMQKASRELPLVLVSRAGNRENKVIIGSIKSLGDATNQLYNLDINAPLARDLVLGIADRVGVLQSLKSELKRRENYDDQLKLALYLEGIKLNAPVLRDPECEEVEFSIDFVPFLAGGKTPALKINDRKRPFTVSIGELQL